MVSRARCKNRRKRRAELMIMQDPPLSLFEARVAGNIIVMPFSSKVGVLGNTSVEDDRVVLRSLKVPNRLRASTIAQRSAAQ